ncbi:aminotransferase class IV [Acidomonas methanolica]|uniref:aminotransferase class IV n=1 Tax=Acidomonas methanolica TaxID=437 RepID=UPI002119E160|nr:aminotransferase class IV [Acidomonas methanolica]MCQ9154201.1 aminotransferase class IV [Acidomonas methanolica]
MNPHAVIWLNDRLVPRGEACISASDRGFLFGDGVFETMRVAGGQLPLLDRHFARLAEGCRVLRLPPPDRPALREAVEAVVAANALANGAVRLTCSRGPGPRGITPPADPSPTVMIAAYALQPPALPPLRVHVSRQVRDGTSVLSRIKTTNYLPSIMARFEAIDAGADEALLRNPAGRIASASIGALVVLAGDHLVTPFVDEGAMESISRALLLEQGLAREGLVFPDFNDIRAAWVISALSVRPIGSVGRVPLAVDKSWTERIRACIHPHPEG